MAIFASADSPPMANHPWHYQAMTPSSDQNMSRLQAVLASNLQRHMDAKPHVGTQQKLAARAGVSQSTVGRLLRGEVSPLLGHVESLAEALGTTVMDLLSEPGAADSIQYDRAAYAALPEQEKKKIETFIEFVIATNRGMNFTEVTAPPAHQAEAIAKASGRPLDHRTLTHNETTRLKRDKPVKRS